MKKAVNQAICGSGLTRLAQSVWFCEGLGMPIITQTVCSLSLGECTYLLVLLWKLVNGEEGGL